MADRAAVRTAMVGASAGLRPVEAVEGDAVNVTSNPDAIRRLRRVLSGGGLPDVYVTNGSPVQIERVSGTPALAVDEDAPLPIRATTITGAHLALILAHEVVLNKMTPTGWQEWTPPQSVLSAVLAGAEWPGLPVLAGIIGTPIVRPDGSLLQEPGYDRRTGLYLAMKMPFEPIAPTPTPEEVEAARRFVFDDLLGDFEFESEADRANYLGLLLTPLLRRYLRSRTPLGIISATMPGSGKSTLTALVGLLAGQKVLPWADDDAELRKQITSAFELEAGVVVFDNLDEGTVIASPILANLMTSAEWSDRILGGSRIGSWPNERLWLANGNNLRVGKDIASRSVLTRLSPRAPHPEQRSGFTIPNLDGWILEPANQAKVLRGLLVLVVDWTASGGQRDHSLPPMRNFTPWAQGIGGLLAHHGVKGFLTNIDDLRATDEHDQKWAGFLHRWLTHHGGVTPKRAREIFESAVIVEHGGHEQDPWDGLFITSDRGGRPRNAVQLGQWLKSHDGRFHGTLRIRSKFDTHTKITSWYVESFADPDKQARGEDK